MPSAIASFRPPDGDVESPLTASLGFRGLRPGVEAEVQEKREQPAHVASRIAAGPVRKCAGPWRSGGDWWSESAWRLQEWDIELSTGLYRLSCDLSSQAWCLVGVYD